MLDTAILKKITGACGATISGYTSALPLEAKIEARQKAWFTLADAMTILVAERLVRKGMPKVAALACAGTIADEFRRICADDGYEPYAFVIQDVDTGQWATCIAQDHEEAANLLEAQPAATVLNLRALAAEFMAEIAAAEKARKR